MIIRALLPADRPEWIRMRCALWPQEDPADLAIGEVSFGKAAQRDGGSAVFVAEREAGGLAGIIEVGLRDVAESATSSPVGYIEGWYVDPDARRAGAGRALVARAEAWARLQGCTEMASDTELGNRVSQDVHRLLGYQETERLVTFLKRL